MICPPLPSPSPSCLPPSLPSPFSPLYSPPPSLLYTPLPLLSSILPSPFSPLYSHPLLSLLPFLMFIYRPQSLKTDGSCMSGEAFGEKVPVPCGSASERPTRWVRLCRDSPILVTILSRVLHLRDNIHVERQADPLGVQNSRQCRLLALPLISQAGRTVASSRLSDGGKEENSRGERGEWGGIPRPSPARFIFHRGFICLSFH